MKITYNICMYLQVENCKFQVGNYKLQIENYNIQVGNYKSHTKHLNAQVENWWLKVGKLISSSCNLRVTSWNLQAMYTEQS
jgi:hypothetical protein